MCKTLASLNVAWWNWWNSECVLTVWEVDKFHEVVQNYYSVNHSKWCNAMRNLPSWIVTRGSHMYCSPDLIHLSVYLRSKSQCMVGMIVYVSKFASHLCPVSCSFVVIYAWVCIHHNVLLLPLAVLDMMISYSGMMVMFRKRW